MKFKLAREEQDDAYTLSKAVEAVVGDKKFICRVIRGEVTFDFKGVELSIQEKKVIEAAIKQARLLPKG